MTVIFAPFIGQVGKVEPYISLTEFKFSATAAALDFTNLVATGGQSAQDRALHELIIRASGKIDAHIYGKFGTLNATSNTQNGRYRTDRDGRFKIHPGFTPVIGVSSFSWGVVPGSLSALALTTSNVWIEEESIVVLPWNSAGTTTVYSGTNALSMLLSDYGNEEFYTEFTYINGYPNTFTTTSTAAGVSALVVTDPTGFYPGTNFTVWDGMNDEYCQVSSSYVPGTSTLTLTNPLTYAHGVGVNVSQMHTNIKQACIHFVIAMVKERGQGGILLNEMGAETMVSAKAELSVEDEMAAYDLLDEFKSIWGRM